MNRSFRLTLKTIAAAALLGLTSAQTANAALSLEVTIGSATTDVTSYLANDGSGNYSFSNGSSSNLFLIFMLNGDVVGTSATSSVAAGRIAIQVAINDNSQGGAVAQLSNQVNVARTNGGGGPIDNLTIKATESQFSSPIGNVALSGLYSSAGGTGNSVAGYVSSLVQGGSTLASVNGPGTSNPLNLVGTYSLQSVTSYTELNPNESFTIGGQTWVAGTGSTNTSVAAVPEPSTVALAFSGLGTLGFVRLRRRRTTQASA